MLCMLGYPTSHPPPPQPAGAALCRGPVAALCGAVGGLRPGCSLGRSGMRLSSFQAFWPTNWGLKHIRPTLGYLEPQGIHVYVYIYMCT